MRESNFKAYGTVLIIRFSALGDVAMTVPPVIDAALASPDTQFVMLTRPLPSRTFGPPETLPKNLKILPVDLRRFEGLPGLWRLAGKIVESIEPDIVIDLHDVLRSRIISLFLRLRRGIRTVRIHKGRRDKKALTAKRNKKRLRLMTGDARYRDTFSRAGLPVPPRFDGFYSDIRRARLARPQRTPRLAMAPFAAHAGKEWPQEHIEQVISHFAERPGMEILLFGAGRREKDIIARWAEKWPGTVVDMAARGLPLQEEMREMADCDVMLSMDSANMHLASLTSTPVVSVWGATHLCTGFLGWRQEERDAVGLDMECRPCSVFGNKPCHIVSDGCYPCLQNLTPPQVIAAIERHLP